jgi:hypothetical protein
LILLTKDGQFGADKPPDHRHGREPQC